MEFVTAKSILTKSNYGNDWFGIDYQMNLYRGCSHGCIYCDSRSECYHVEDFDRVRSKKDVLLLLERELARKKNKGLIGIGSMSDSYNPMERKYEITRKALQLIRDYGFGVEVATKSTLVLRDIDLLQQINAQNPVIVSFTITTFDDFLANKLEPGASFPSARFQAIQTLSERGIFVGILLMPVLPFLTDSEENIRTIVDLAHHCGAKFIYPYMGVTLRQNQREYYYHKLDHYFPGLTQKYRERYGASYHCPANKAQKLYRIFADCCDRYGIFYRMEDIIGASRPKKKNEQMSLFILEEKNDF